MGTKTVTFNEYNNNQFLNTPVNIGISMGTYEYPDGAITFSSPSWKENTGTTRQVNFYLCDSAGNNRVKIGGPITCYGSSRIYTSSFSASGGTALAGKALYLICTFVSGGTESVATSFAETSKTDITVTYSVLSYSVSTAVSPSGTGTLTASKYTANPGDTISLTPSAGTGYHFSSYSSSPSVTITNNAFTMPGSNVTITANFAKTSYTLTTGVSPSGYGSVTAGGSMEYQATKSLTATPGTGRYFSSWSNSGGSLSSTTTNPTTFTMGAGNATVTANFGTNSYTLTVTNGTGGGSKAYGSSNSISANSITGYTFSYWSSNNGGSFANAYAASTTFTMPAGNVTVTANYTINSYTLTTAVSPSGYGTVTAGGSMNYGGTKSLTATPSTGRYFSSWSKTAGTLSSTTTNPTTFTMGTSAATVTANFGTNSYTLTTAVSPSGGGTVTAGGSISYGGTKSLTATASTGYSFSSWSKTAGSLSSTTTNPTTFTMGAGNATVTANFTHNQYTLTTASSPSAGGTTSGGGTKYYNDSCSISATAATGYSFSKWTASGGGSFANANAASTTYTMPNGNATVTASFTHNSYTLSSAVSPSGAGTVTLGSTSGYYNDTINISAAPATGYVFSGWTTSGGTLGDASAASTTITLPAANTTVTASFTAIDYYVTTEVDPGGSGTVTANPTTAHYGDTVTLTQEPAFAYAFDGYTSNPSVTITNGQFSMPASDITITGNFHITKSTGSLDKSTYEGGETAVLSISLASDAFTHRYKLSFGTGMETEWVTLAAGVGSANIYIPVAWCVAIPGNATSITGGSLTLETYDNGTLLGTDIIGNLTYVVLDETMPQLNVWRCDSNNNPDIVGEYVGYSTVIPESMSSYTVSHGPEPLAVSQNHNVVLSMTYDSETFTITRDIPKVLLVKKKIVSN